MSREPIHILARHAVVAAVSASVAMIVHRALIVVIALNAASARRLARVQLPCNTLNPASILANRHERSHGPHRHGRLRSDHARPPGLPTRHGRRVSLLLRIMSARIVSIRHSASASKPSAVIALNASSALARVGMIAHLMRLVSALVHLSAAISAVALMATHRAASAVNHALVLLSAVRLRSVVVTRFISRTTVPPPASTHR